MALDSSIRDLVSKAQAGDREAFDALVRAYGRRLDALVRSRMGARIHEDLEPADVVQETLLRAFGTIDRFRWRGENSLLSWLGAIAENVILNATKRLARRPTFRLDRSVAVGGTSPSRGMRRNERFERLETAIEGLSDDHRKVVVLARIEGLSTREIARRMDRSENAVKTLLVRALRALRRAFGDTESLALPDRQLGPKEGNDGE